MKHISDVVAEASLSALREAAQENARLRTALRRIVEAWDSPRRCSGQHLRVAIERGRSIVAERALPASDEPEGGRTDD